MTIVKQVKINPWDSKEYSILIGACTYFFEEATLLQLRDQEIGKSLGLSVIMERTPKYHPEVSGEVIEYTWAQSNIYMRSVPINKRSSIEQFRNNVRLALNDGDGEKLSRVKVKKFSTRARDYIAACHILAQEKKTMIKLTQNY